MYAGSTVNAITLTAAVFCECSLFTSLGVCLPIKTWSQVRVFNPEVHGNVSWKCTKNFNISNAGNARIQIFLWEKPLISLAFFLLMALKPACAEREVEIQG